MPPVQHRVATGSIDETADPSHAGPPAAGWPEIDGGLLEEWRAAVPPFPLDHLPEPWRDWVSGTARATGAPADYVAQAVLAGVAGLSGAGVAVRVTGSWSEPLVLWQALVGGPSSGKSPALAPVRRLLATLEDELRAADEAKPQIVAADSEIDALADIVGANPRGVVLWRDTPSPWLWQLGTGRDRGDRARWLDAWGAGKVAIVRSAGEAPRQLERFPVSVLASIHPERLEETLRGSDDGLAARFLYSWPARPRYHPLAERRQPDEEQALAMLRRIMRKARTPDDPLVLTIDEHGVKEFDRFLAGLQAEIRGADGLETGWLGKGAGTVARLAGALELLAWSGLAAPGPPGQIGRDRVAAAACLWRDYFRPHARAVFEWAAPTELVLRARRVVRWLRGCNRDVVSREDVRRHALGRTLSAEATDLVLRRLDAAGVVRPASREISPRGGRPAQLWQINPALAAA